MVLGMSIKYVPSRIMLAAYTSENIETASKVNGFWAASPTEIALTQMSDFKSYSSDPSKPVKKYVNVGKYGKKMDYSYFAFGAYVNAVDAA